LGVEIGIRTWSALMIAMRADAMSGRYWVCHDVSSVLSLWKPVRRVRRELRIVGRPPCMTKRATIQSSEAN
jgi:hypothetical protein